MTKMWKPRPYKMYLFYDVSFLLHIYNNACFLYKLVYVLRFHEYSDCNYYINLGFALQQVNVTKEI